jgi:hypothetical protein
VLAADLANASALLFCSRGIHHTWISIFTFGVVSISLIRSWRRLKRSILTGLLPWLVRQPFLCDTQDMNESERVN